jgi:Fic family protein
VDYGTKQRTYLGTHSWIDFTLDLRRADPAFWMLLGEARSKIEHIAGSLLRPENAHELHQVFLAKGVLATTAIEGNTLSEEDARELIEGTLRLPPSQAYLAREMQNIIDAFNGIVGELVQGTAWPLSRGAIENYNGAILRELDLEEHVVAGEVRRGSVVVANYRGAPAEDCGYLLERLCEWLDGDAFVPPTAEWALPYAILKAIVAHLYVAWIHPFGDGNGRTARLIELRILLEAGVPTPAVHPLSNHYNQTRTEYYRQLARASRTEAGVFDFVRYAAQGFVDGLGEQLSTIREQQFQDRWEQYIYQRFGGASGPTEHRRRRLVLELSKAGGPVPKSQLRRLSTQLYELYESKTDKTLTRDLNALTEMGLIRRAPQGYVPDRDVIQAFLPLVAEAHE